MVSNDPIWFSPIRAYSEYLKLVETVGSEAIETDRKYEKALETKSLAILCFALFVMNKTPWFLQLCRKDPPDGLIMRVSPDKPGDHDILGVEVTSYFRNKTGLPQESILEQLKKTKMFKEYHKYSEHDAILVHLGLGYKPNVIEIHEYMAKIKAPYQLWFLQEVQAMPDTIAEITICNAQNVAQRKVNIGKAWNDMKQQKVFGAIRTIRVGSIDKVGTGESEPIIGAPWELMA